TCRHAGKYDNFVVKGDKAANERGVEMNRPGHGLLGRRIFSAGLVSQLVLVLIFAAGCSLEKMALKKAAGMLTAPSAGTVFTGDDDPELVAGALPFAIKFYESLLASLPEHAGLRLRTGSLYIMYASAFIQAPADMTPATEVESRQVLLARAKKLYLRGRDMLLAGLERKNPRLREQLRARQFKKALSPYGLKDIDFLYWAAAGWVAAYSIDPFDMSIGLTLPEAAALMNRVLELEPNYSDGAVHNFYILYYGSLPQGLGGDENKAREHFRQAEKLCGDSDTSYLLSLATTVAVKNQNRQEFISLLKKVMEFNPDQAPQNRLVNILNKRKAAWLLEHVDDFFLPPEDGQEDSTGGERKK
ncbi:MAG: TRAP transporter TatT component family protein, partial [Candidatus Saccharicenans sp.]|nr:TRAP transporter TatT component family protein [Candidatus Saccharicenans sp.]